MPGPPFLHGERVDLHTVVEADAEFIARGRNDPVVRPWLLRSRPHAVTEAREDVEGYTSDDSDGLGLLTCVDGDPVGCCRCSPSRPTPGARSSGPGSSRRAVFR